MIAFNYTGEFMDRFSGMDPEILIGDRTPSRQERVLNSLDEDRLRHELQQLVGDPELVEFLLERDVEIITIFDDEMAYDYNYCGEQWEGLLDRSDVKVLRFRHAQAETLPEPLPQGYMYMGGVARNTRLLEFGDDLQGLRDIDLIAIEEFDPDRSLVADLAASLMPEDSQHGYGVKLESLLRFFCTRDFTINEIMVDGTQIIASPQAVRDLHNKVIRPSDYEMYRDYDYWEDEPNIRSRLVLKALRFQLRFELAYGDAEIEDIPRWQFHKLASHFEIALALAKAYEEGDVLSALYCERILALGLVRPLWDGLYVQEPTLREMLLIAKRHLTKIDFVRGKPELDAPGTPEEYRAIQRKAVGKAELEFDRYAQMATDYILTHGIKGHDSRDLY